MTRFIHYVFILFFVSDLGYASIYSQTSASLLFGKSYRMPANLDDKYDVTTLTMEHFSTWKFGDNFFFLDIYNIHDGDNLTSSPPKLDGTREFYFEWHPRFSAKKIFFSDGESFISDYGISTEVNVPMINSEAYLAGIYVDFSIPNYGFIQTNYFVKDAIEIKGVSFQLSLVWFFRFFDRINFTGFADFATKEGTENSEDGYLAPSIIAQPQLLYDFGVIQLGVEWYYWKNKFSIKGPTDSVFAPMAKWIF